MIYTDTLINDYTDAAFRTAFRQYFGEMGYCCVLLTTATAPDFYRKHGYTLQTGVEARNKADVYLKPLLPL